MEERISTYELGKWRAQLRAIQEELELLTEHLDLFEVYERNNPESIVRIANLK